MILKQASSRIEEIFPTTSTPASSNDLSKLVELHSRLHTKLEALENKNLALRTRLAQKREEDQRVDSSKRELMSKIQGLEDEIDVLIRSQTATLLEALNSSGASQEVIVLAEKLLELRVKLIVQSSNLKKKNEIKHTLGATDSQLRREIDRLNSIFMRNIQIQRQLPDLREKAHRFALLKSCHGNLFLEP